MYAQLLLNNRRLAVNFLFCLSILFIFVPDNSCRDESKRTLLPIDVFLEPYTCSSVFATDHAVSDMVQSLD